MEAVILAKRNGKVRFAYNATHSNRFGTHVGLRFSV